MKTKSRLRVAMCVLAGLAVFAISSRAVTIPNEYWISTNTDSLNQGTLDNPFIANTADLFDSRMAGLPPNSVIHLLPGAFHTSGNHNIYNWEVRTGQHILGSGIDRTVIQLDPKETCDGAWVLTSGEGTNIMVADLTIDGNYPATAGFNKGNNTIFGLAVTGSKCAIVRVRAIHLSFYDHSKSSECWGIGIGTPKHASSSGNLIRDCEVSQFCGTDGLTCFSFNGYTNEPISGTMENDRVELPGGAAFGWVGFNGANMHDCLFEHDYVFGASFGFYGDTGGYSNVVVDHCEFENCEEGVAVMSDKEGDRRNLTFSDNTIKLSPAINHFRHNEAFFFYNTGTHTTFTNITITGNLVDLYGPPQEGETYYFVNANQVGGLNIIGNRVNNAMNSSLIHDHAAPNLGLNVYDNLDLNGNFLTNDTPFPQVAPPNGVTRVNVAATSYYANWGDFYIAMRARNKGARNVYLPKTRGNTYPGKEFVIADEAGTGHPIKIVAQGGEINGAKSVSFNTAYGAMTVITDGTNWFAHF